MPYDIEIRDIAPQPIASVRITTTPPEVGVALTQNLLPRVYGFLSDHQIVPSGPPVAVYHDWAPDRVGLEGGVLVAAPISGDGTVTASELPGGRAAVTRHVGPYVGLGEAHEAVRHWILANGQEILGPSWEIYHMPPGGEPDSAKWTTEVFWRIR